MRFRQGRDRSLSGFSGWTWAPRMLVTGQFNVCPAALTTQNRPCRQELEPSRRSYVAHQTSTTGWRPRDSGLYVPRPRFAPIPSPRAQHLELFAASNQLKLQTGKIEKRAGERFALLAYATYSAEPFSDLGASWLTLILTLRLFANLFSPPLHFQYKSWLTLYLK